MIWSYTFAIFWLVCLILDCTWYTQITPPFIPSHSICSNFILEYMIRKPNKLSSTHTCFDLKWKAQHAHLYAKHKTKIFVSACCSSLLFIRVVDCIAFCGALITATAVFGKESCLDSSPFQFLPQNYSMLVRWMRYIVWIRIKSSS